VLGCEVLARFELDNDLVGNEQVQAMEADVSNWTGPKRSRAELDEREGL
jgi:hypothetical protein